VLPPLADLPPTKCRRCRVEDVSGDYFGIAFDVQEFGHPPDRGRLRRRLSVTVQVM
jgi:hypothetical protein